MCIEEEMAGKILSIDPSTIRMGWACTSYPAPAVASSDLGYWTYGSLNIGEGTLEHKLHVIQHWLTNVKSVDFIVGEKPVFYNNAQGMIAAQEGYTINLGIVLGFIIGHFGCKFKFYSAPQWKGQVSKDVTRAKFIRKFQQYPPGKMNHDTIDAIMILHHHLYNS